MLCTDGHLTTADQRRDTQSDHVSAVATRKMDVVHCTNGHLTTAGQRRDAQSDLVSAVATRKKERKGKSNGTIQSVFGNGAYRKADEAVRDSLHYFSSGGRAL